MNLPTIFAPIKINLALHVGPPKPDGYHPVDTLCVFPAIGDILSYDPEGDMALDFGGRYGAELAEHALASNLVFKAFALLDELPRGRFFLMKETPIASGVGAGTADGAAAMLLLNDVLELGFSAHELVERSLGLGADGPVCMASQISGGGLWRAERIGERLTWMGQVEPQAIVVANPGMAVSTGRVFRRFDADAPAVLSPPAASRGPKLTAIVAESRNDLEASALAEAREIAALKQRLAEQPGAQVVRMSGSGATCYALHTSLSSAERACRVLEADGLWAQAAPLLSGQATGLGS